jgi:hypothetical protein
MAGDDVRWWTLRAARSLKPTTYRCPFCAGYLHAGSDHVLIAPEGDASRRRHAHVECARREREAGRLPSRDEWLRAEGRQPGLLARLRRRGWLPADRSPGSRTNPGS